MAKKGDGPPRSQEFIDDSDAAIEAESGSEEAEVKPTSKSKKASKSDSKQASKVCMERSVCYLQVPSRS